MKKQLNIFILVLILVAGIYGCAENPSSDEGGTIPELENSSASNQSSEDADIVSIPPESSVILDFAVLPEEDFPRGTWTINQLIDKYGETGMSVANYMPAYESVYVRIKFASIVVHFAKKDVTCFSFYKDSLEQGDYDLDDNDRNLEMVIVALFMYDSKIEFPYDLKIGESIKSQVLEAYPTTITSSYQSENSDPYIDLISYSYAFFEDGEKLSEGVYVDVGTVSYLFDESEVLNRVNIEWASFDL